MVFHWHKSIRTLILPAGASVTGFIVEGERPTTVTLDLADIKEISKRPEYLSHLANALRPIPRKNQQEKVT